MCPPIQRGSGQRAVKIGARHYFLWKDHEDEYFRKYRDRILDPY